MLTILYMDDIFNLNLHFISKKIISQDIVLFSL